MIIHLIAEISEQVGIVTVNNMDEANAMRASRKNKETAFYPSLIWA